MKTSFYFTLLTFSLFLVNSQNALAQQNAEVNIIQDSKIPKLLDLKTKMTKNNDLTDNYKIQIMGYGDLNDANSVLNKYKTNIDKWPGTVAYQTPNYKVWVGHFNTRIEADRALIEVQRVFPNAFVFEPKK